MPRVALNPHRDSEGEPLIAGTGHGVATEHDPISKELAPILGPFVAYLVGDLPKRIFVYFRYTIFRISCI